jgi:hypothetical protein
MPHPKTTTRNNPGMPIAERFWQKVQKAEEIDGCWIWRSEERSRGRGVFILPGNIRVIPARVAWELTNGPIPTGMEVCHNCPSGDNPRCVRPSHLFLGTHAENMADAVCKGRMAHGERSGGAKLTAETVREIRALYDSGVSQNALSRKYGLSQGYVSMLVRKKWWRHL